MVSASELDDTLSWHENLNGAGTSWTSHVISTAGNNPAYAFVVDMNSDSDMDVVLATEFGLSWYEADGLDASAPEYFTMETVSRNVSAGDSIFAIDLDQDGDIDVLSADHDNKVISWSENVDGSGTVTSFYFFEF